MKKRRDSRKKTIMAVLFIFIVLLCMSLIFQNIKLRKDQKAILQKLEEIEHSVEQEEECRREDIKREIEKSSETEVPIEPPTTQAASIPEETKSIYLTGVEELQSGTTLEASQIDTEKLSQYFTAAEIMDGDAVYLRINGKSYRKNKNIALSDLRYMKLLHYNFKHQIQVGELIVNKKIANDMIEIFEQLFDMEYEIASMHLIDDYWTGDGDSSDYASIEVNNTSAFCYRQITGGGRISNHGYGLAIDINPQQNPYVKTDSSGTPHWAHKNANNYIARDGEQKHMITEEDQAYRIFCQYGFKWGGEWGNPKDYQHFEKK